MKKIVCMLLLIQSGFIIGQVKTVVTPYGEKVQIDTSPQWILDGNNNGAVKTIGTNDAFDLPIETNNVERMRVTSAGQVLINTAAPLIGGTTAKIQINNDNTAGALQIKDGTEALGRVLTSNANGLATWQDGQKSNFRSFNCNAKSDVTLALNDNIALPGIDAYIAPNTGNYELIFHSFFYNPGISEMKSFYVNVYINGIMKYSDESYVYAMTSGFINIHYPTIIFANTGDIITVKFQAYVGAPLTIPTSLAPRNRLDFIFLGV